MGRGRIGQAFVGGIAVALQDAAVATEQRLGIFLPAPGA